MKKLTLTKLAIVVAVALGVAFFGFVRSPRVEPDDADLATLVHQARDIGAAWRQFHDEPGPRQTVPHGALIELLRDAVRLWWAETLGGGSDSFVTRDLTDKNWGDGSSDLAPYFGAFPVPPSGVVDVQDDYSNWIAVWANDPAFFLGPHGYAQPPKQASSGFLVRLDPARPELCRQIAQAAGRGNGLPYAVTGRPDWARASGLRAGEYACVWIDSNESGTLDPGDPTFLLFRAI